MTVNPYDLNAISEVMYSNRKPRNPRDENPYELTKERNLRIEGGDMIELNKADQRIVVSAEQADTIIRTLLREMENSRVRIYEVIDLWGKRVVPWSEDFAFIAKEHCAILGAARSLVTYMESLYTTREMVGGDKG